MTMTMITIFDCTVHIFFMTNRDVLYIHYADKKTFFSFETINGSYLEVRKSYYNNNDQQRVQAYDYSDFFLQSYLLRNNILTRGLYFNIFLRKKYNVNIFGILTQN